MSIYEGVKGWGVDYRDEWGRRKRLIVGSKAAAQALDAQLSAQARAARSKLQTFQASQDLTALQLLEAWQAQRFVQPKTQAGELRHMKRFLARHGHEPAADLTPEQLGNYLRARSGECAPSTVYQEARLLRNAFGWAESAAIIPASPAAHLQAPRPRYASGIALGADQEKELLRACSPRAQVKALLGLDAGLARTDIAALTRGQIDLTERRLTYYRAKTRVHTIVPLTARLHTALSLYCQHVKEPSARLFKVHPEHNRFLQFARHRLAFAVTVHDLRHTFISKVARTGVRARIVQALAGHAPQTPTEKYDHPTLQELRETISAMETATEKEATKP